MSATAAVAPKLRWPAEIAATVCCSTDWSACNQTWLFRYSVSSLDPDEFPKAQKSKRQFQTTLPHPVSCTLPSSRAPVCRQSETRVIQHKFIR
jgi:hypothetical protein